MSYARWSKDSAVYVFWSVPTIDAMPEGHIECCACDLPGNLIDVRSDTLRADLDAHFAEHIARYELVPEGMVDWIVADVMEERDGVTVSDRVP